MFNFVLFTRLVSVALLVIALCGLCSSKAIAAAKQSNSASKSSIQSRTFDIYNQDKQRPVKLNVWYKQGECAEDKADKFCLSPKVSGNKVVFLSHGAMGSAKDYRWLAYPLAAQGWVVVGLNHFGESWAYGPANSDPSAAMRLWQRAEDSSFVMNALMKNNPFQKPVSWESIVFIGHSSGGQTAASLAGVTLNIEQIGKYCRSEVSQADLGCSYAKGKQAEKTMPLPAYQQSFSDPRVKAVVMLDPAVGPAATMQSLKNVSVPALVIGAQNNDFLPFKYHAGYYAKHIPKAKLVSLNNNEGHFVFLDSCSHQYKAQGISLCKDREGVNRKDVHKQLLGHIIPFISAI